MTTVQPARPRTWVLIVDPNRRTADRAADRLHGAGLDIGIREVHAASTALVDVKEHDYRAIIVEPGIAADAAGFIRQLLGLADAPVRLIAWTRIDNNDWKALIEAGAYQVIAKDDTDDLVAEVRSILGR